ncbi:MAG: LytTR family transcriptional regulator [Saprospiraceae bacterium]|nr:LytTR family transcriptional regulator [Saprospiraceae bacterium]
MLQFLTAPYPFHRNLASGLAFSIGAGAFVALFLLVFQPFGTREFEHEHKQLFLAGYGVVIAAFTWLCSNLLPRVSPKLFDEEHWTVGKHILFSVLVFLLVFVACYVYKDVALGHPVSWRGFFGFLPFAFSIAIFPIAGLVIGSYMLRLKHHSKVAEAANSQIHPIAAKPAPQSPLNLLDENGKVVLQLLPSQVLYLQAADNYVEVFYLENGQSPRRSILRNTLTNLESSLADAGLFRCHRSYLVNLGQVERVSGNAQGYRLQFAGLEASVPVARGRSAEVLEKLR